MSAIADEMKRKFLSKTARTQGQSIMYFRDPFKLVPVSSVAEIADKLSLIHIYQLMKKTDTEMGKISNLITDMTLAGADDNKMARAVRHSMVVIDAEKHHLDYKQSEIDNNIPALKKEYQAHYDSTGHRCV